MKIAATMNVHAYPKLVTDTLESIKLWMTDRIHITVDAAGWDYFSDFDFDGIKPQIGVYHNFWKSPHRNVCLALKRVYEAWPNMQWYCYIEYDCLVTSNFFIEDLNSAWKRGVWILANDHRTANVALPPEMLKITNIPVTPIHTVLGCCVFYRCDFLKRLHQERFFDRFIDLTEPFDPGVFPDFHDHAFEETLFPSLAVHYGGKVEELAAWKGRWRGRAERFPMRCPNAITAGEISPAASIIHPLKSYDDPIRDHFRVIRNTIKRKTK